MAAAFLHDVTALGSITNLTLLTLGVAGYLLLCRAYSRVALLAASILGGMLIENLLKRGFDRPRPDLVPHGVDVYTASFPSGHAMLSAVVFLTFGAMIASVQTSRWLRAYLLGLAIALSLLIGFSRVYLGVHWPSDVLAGWAVGSGWAALVWLISRSLRRPAGPPPD